MPRHKRLRQPDLLDEVRNGRVRLGELLDDPQAVDVGERLVDDTELAEVLGLEDRICDRAADVRAGWTQVGRLVRPADRDLGSTGVYINGG
jgi:hypothetical protein